MIKWLDKTLSEYIKAQQYIHNTYTIVKELIENSVDASSRVIKILIGENDIIVDDDGEGILDLTCIGEEHTTSKEFTSYSVLGLTNDNSTNNSNGYRGMALNSIKNLCDVEITTKHDLNKCAKTVDKASRDKGTAVKIYNIFKDCSIRKTQNTKNIAKHVKKIADLIESYACVNDIHFVFYYLNKQILNVKGHKTLQDYIDFKYKDLKLTSLISDTPYYYLFVLSNLEKIANCRIFLNKRVVESLKIRKAIKETYNLFNEGKPTFYINFKGRVDFNISPDKSEFILNNENEILRNIKNDIIHFFRENAFVKSIVPLVKSNESNIDNLRNSEDLIKTNTFNKPDTVINDVITYQQLFDDVFVPKALYSKEGVDQDVNIIASSIDQSSSDLNKPKSLFVDSSFLKHLNKTIKTEGNDCREDTKDLDPLDSISGGCLIKEKVEEDDECKGGNNVNLYLQSPKSDKFESSNCYKLELSANAFTYINFMDDYTESIHIKKSDFVLMDTLRQFNNGFILNSLRKDNKTYLILIDQHAADEIYNYEKLQKTMKIQKQKLIVPIKPSLTSVDEIYLEEHLSTFSTFGFEILNGEIMTIPQVGKVLFGIDDFFDILEDLKQNEVKFERLHDIYASKACRTSVMIGENLTLAKMGSIVKNLARLNNPWKYPHGRPIFLVLKELIHA